MASNGKLSSSALTTVEPGVKLAVKTARAYKRWKLAAGQRGWSIRIPAPAGGYRSFWTQNDMHVHPERYGLNPHSTVPIAEAGYSSHGYGTRVDIVGTPITQDLLTLARQFGFTREFGSADPNHFMHDGVTATSVSDTKVSTSKPNKIVSTLKDGKPNATFYKRLQWFARKNGYVGTIDGVLGVNSWKGVQHGLESYGYIGTVDGKPDEKTYKALQKLAQKRGEYDGPIDGKLGRNSYIALSKFLNTL